MTKIISLDKARPVDKGPVTEDSTALEFVDRFGEHLRFDHSTRAWFRFDGARWRRDGTGVAHDWAREIARDMALSAREDRARYAIGRAGFAKGVETMARNDQRIAVEGDIWDCNPDLLGTPGGTISLRSGELIEPAPEHFISRITATAPAGSDRCPRFRDFLDEAMGDDHELVAFVRRWFGYCLTGRVSEHALVFIVGEGGNGKSVLLNTMRGILGSYAVNAAMDSFVSSYGDKHPADMAALHGARLVTASETEAGRAWDEVRLKTLTGGDPITARHMRRDFFTFTPTFKLTFSGNHKPDLRSVNQAMRRRINIIEMNIRPRRVDPDLEQKLQSEWPQILRWALTGAVEWYDAGLGRPDAIKRASEAYFRDQDIFGRWAEDECVFEPGNELVRTPSSRLWDSWRAYSLANGKSPGRQNELADRLERRGAKRYWSRDGRGFSGVMLRGETQ